MKSISAKVIMVFLIISFCNLQAQDKPVLLSENIWLPKDSITTQVLIKSFNEFIYSKNNPATQNEYVLPKYILETSVLLDELKDIEKSTKYKSDTFYTCYIHNILKLTSTEYLIQFYYIGQDQNTPILRANYNILAQKKQGRFYFYSPLKQNTISWQTKTIDHTIVFYKKDFEFSKVEAYLAKVNEYDKILGVPKQPTQLYCAENFNEALKLIGVDYKSDYNGYSYNTLVTKIDDTSLIIDGILASDYENFDPHDLWHSRLRNILPRKKTYKPVDEGCAFLFGGSWGYSWDEILNKFKRFIIATPNTDWLSLYNEGKNYGDETGKALRVDYTINALLVKKIKKEQGFSEVFKLLSCGKRDEDYFPVLEEVTGITKDSFNHDISKLIQEIN
ncbi:hypothetical protein [Aquimarina sp. I32.4]|uniref:hypothetical protein n=1 Tax=Aquimarina sp. I32.4 TaxID=2053903 RepID=UPI000CDF2972|nr:hypothetical protein [Aquimarina sp. I32.4]